MSRDRLDPQQLALVSPQHVRSYATSHNWERVPNVNGNLVLFQHREKEQEQIIVPSSADLIDYTRRLEEVIFVLAEIESRSPESVLNDLLLPEADLIRYRVRSLETENGTMLLSDGARLLDGAQRSLLAAACSAIAPQTYHPRMSRAAATQLLNCCRLGQTEKGSFTLTIVCPLRAVEQQPTLQGIETFTRRTTTMLMRSLHRLIHAIEQDQVSSIGEESATEPVISANLCEALLRMQPPQDRSSLIISASWASALLSPPDDVQSQVAIQSEYFPIIEEIGRSLRPSPALATAVFVGYVDTLDGDVDENGHMQGETSILVLHEEEVVRAHVDLGPDDYQRAVDAHRQGQPISLRGVLHRSSRSNRINEVSDLRLLEQETAQAQNVHS